MEKVVFLAIRGNTLLRKMFLVKFSSSFNWLLNFREIDMTISQAEVFVYIIVCRTNLFYTAEIVRVAVQGKSGSGLQKHFRHFYRK